MRVYYRPEPTPHESPVESPILLIVGWVAIIVSFSVVLFLFVADFILLPLSL
ncbi:MAG TPA: hypothetical protein V6C81_31205 [Planktothrix sp.]|jgi:hypothetical protein